MQVCILFMSIQVYCIRINQQLRYAWFKELNQLKRCTALALRQPLLTATVCVCNWPLAGPARSAQQAHMRLHNSCQSPVSSLASMVEVKPPWLSIFANWAMYSWAIGNHGFYLFSLRGIENISEILSSHPSTPPLYCIVVYRSSKQGFDYEWK